MEIRDEFGEDTTLSGLGDSTDHQELSRGTSIDRYLVVELIGSGGMGAVYRAYDPKLNRGVALKILSVKQEDGKEAEKAKSRLIREAQSLAQLSHPNVVAVHDYGSFGDDVFIAMELVEGKTLEDWLRSKNRSVKKILEVMTAAGRGLSAAHKAGLIHRDFKPGNVIVGDDGRVRVLDFGLARASDEPPMPEDTGLPIPNGAGVCSANGVVGPMPSGAARDAQEEDPEEAENRYDGMEISSSSRSNLLLAPLTNVGGIVGTPLYMAPEQHFGLKTDERTDQFGFCLVLYEALYGKRPFKATTIEELKAAVIHQQVVIPSAGTGVPAWLWQVIRKGLSADPKNRYPTLALLLEDLEHDPEEVRRQQRLGRRRKLSVILLIILTIAVPIGVWYGLRYRTFQLCKAAEVEFDGVWDSVTKASVQTAFLNTKKSYALGTWERVERRLDSYLAEWTGMRSDVCEAKIIRGTQSEELFDLRMSCLRKRIGDLKALVKVFARADVGVVKKAVQASSSLTGIAICADEEALRAPYPPPETEEAKAKVAAVREKLAEVEALRKTGKYREGLELAKNQEKNANAVAYRPVQAEALYLLGKLLYSTGAYKLAETTLYEAARVAGNSKDSRLVANAMSFLVFVVGSAQGRHEDGLLIGRNAEIDIALSGGDDALRSRFFNNMGSVFFGQAAYDNALKYYRKSLAIGEKARGAEHFNVAMYLNNIGSTFNKQGEQHKALEYHRKALAIQEEALGPDHPDVAYSLNSIGNVFHEQSEVESALEYFRKALAIWEKALGPEHPHVAYPLINIGNLLHAQGVYDQALECFQKAMTIWEKALGLEHHLLALPLNNMGLVFQDQRDYDKALEFHRRALAIREKALGPDHPSVAMSLNNLGEVFSNRGEYAQAMAYFQKSLAIREKALGPNHPKVVWPLSGIGNVYVEQGRPKKALDPLMRAVNICEKETCESDVYGPCLFYLARALEKSGEDKASAIKLARTARDVFGKTPKRFKKILVEVDAWLKKYAN